MTERSLSTFSKENPNITYSEISNISEIKLQNDSNLPVKNLKIFIVCSGLGHVQRGVESFIRECFDALVKDSSMDITLFKGGGPSLEKEVALWNLPRNSWITVQLSGITKKIGEVFKGHQGYHAYYLEQASFTLSLLPYIQKAKPDIIYFSDPAVGDLLGTWKKITNQNWKLLFCDGGPLIPYMPRCDYVQQLVPCHRQLALNNGIPEEKLILLPLGVNINSELQLLSPSERVSLRHKLKLPERRPIVLSVAAINRSHKRVDYIIREVASLPSPRPYLLLLGQRDSESSEMIDLGNSLLGSNNFQVRTVSLLEVENYYKVVDCFILASLSEAFGRVMVEAMSNGLPCLAHDYAVSRFVLGEEGYFDDFSKPGRLANLLSEVLAADQNELKCYSRYRYAFECFSWENLRSQYTEMLLRVSGF